MEMDKTKADNEINYRMSMMIVQYLVEKGILSDDEAKAVLDLLIDEFQPFIGRLERGV